MSNSGAHALKLYYLDCVYLFEIFQNQLICNRFYPMMIKNIRNLFFFDTNELHLMKSKFKEEINF